jgi:hypothetical protein
MDHEAAADLIAKNGWAFNCFFRRMARGTPVVAALLLVAAADAALSQTTALDPSAKDGRLARENLKKQTNPLPAFAAHQKNSKIQIDAIGSPSASDGFSGPPLDGQIHFLDGALQNYLNINNGVNNTDLLGHTRYMLLPFGATAVLPVAGGRLEIHGGFGGLFVPYESSYSKPNSWLTQISLGARIALDPGHHFWLGATSYYLTDFADKTRQWGYGAADLTVRFGK